MAPNQVIPLGAVRGAMQRIGQVPQRSGWADLAHRRTRHDGHTISYFSNGL